MTPDEIQFATDGMLQSLATWLRLLGYDCLAGEELFGRQLLEQAVAENRVFLTRNSHLSDSLPHQLLAHCQIAIVASERLPDQLREVVTRYFAAHQRVCVHPLRGVQRAASSGGPSGGARTGAAGRCRKRNGVLEVSAVRQDLLAG